MPVPDSNLIKIVPFGNPIQEYQPQGSRMKSRGANRVSEQVIDTYNDPMAKAPPKYTYTENRP